MKFPSESELAKMHPIKLLFYRRAQELKDVGYPPECYDIRVRMKRLAEKEPIDIVKRN